MLVCKCSKGTNDPGSLLPSKLLGMPAESTACSLDACASPIISEKAKKKKVELKRNGKKGYGLCQFSLKKKNLQNELSEVVSKADVI